MKMPYLVKYILVIIQFINLLVFTSNLEGTPMMILKTISAVSFLIIHTLLAKYSDFFKEGIL